MTSQTKLPTASNLNRWLILGVCSCLIFLGAIPSLAQATTTEFKQAYQKYQSEMRSENYEQALKAASSAYAISRKIHGNASTTTATMGLNYGQLLLKVNRVVDAELVLRRTVAVSRRAYGDGTLELIDIYMAYGHSVADPFNYKKQRKFYQRAIQIAVSHEGSESRLVADLNLEAGRNLLTRSESDKAGKYLKSALKNYLRLDEGKSIGAGLAHYWLGKLEIGIQRIRHAVPHFENAVTIFQALPNEKDHLLSSYAFLVRVHQELGNNEAATPYCLAIGKLKPWIADHQPKPLWVRAPVYSLSSQSSGERGYAEVTFTLTATGEVKNAQVQSAQGSKEFGSAARDAVVQWRFAPRFVEGNAVETQTSYRVPFPFSI
jgi:TonB family protein